MEKDLHVDNRYQLRYAAGRYFLLDMGQGKDTYKKPLQMNSTGALIIEKLKEGFSEDDIIDCLYKEYQEGCQDDNDESDMPDRDLIAEDVSCFIEQLKKFSVDVQ